MSRPNAILIRFEVLKILKNTPTHGYNLYLLLSQKGLVKHPSELYKILQTLKDRGMLQEESRESEQGPQKKILSLTSNGLEEYYAQITDSIQILTDIMAEAVITIFHNLLTDFLKENTITYEKSALFFDLTYFPPPIQREFLFKFVVPLQEKNSVYVRMIGNQLNDISALLDKIASNLTFLDENLSLKPQSMDHIFLVGRESITLLEGRVKTYANVLKPDGGILIIRPGKSGQGGMLWGMGGEQSPLLGTIFRDFIQTFPEKFRQKFFNQMPPPKEFEEESANISSNSEIMKFLEENFTQVKLHDEISFLSIFVARNPKKNQ